MTTTPPCSSITSGSSRPRWPGSRTEAGRSAAAAAARRSPQAAAATSWTCSCSRPGSTPPARPPPAPCPASPPPRRPSPAHIRGPRSRLLGEEWSNGMAAHASTTVHGFPNMYVLDGPNAALGHNSAIYMIETQDGYVLSGLDHLATSGADALEVTAEAVHSYMRDIDTMARDTV